MSVHGSSREEYDFMEKIGDGAFGQVYRAKHRTTQQLVRNTDCHYVLLVVSL